MTEPLKDLSRLCVHTMTTKPLSLRQCIDAYVQAGIPAITVWRNVLEGVGAEQAGAWLRESGLRVVSLCRGGFFPATSEEGRRKAIDDNRRAVDEAAAIGAPHVVLVCGAVPGLPLDESRRQITDGIAAVLPHAEQAGVRLAIEPLHPMYADDRSAVNTMRQANDMVEQLASKSVGVAVDIFHLWWDPELEAQIARCAALDALFAFHICDWRTPTRDLLNDRGLMGDGCIDIPSIRGWVEANGFRGFNEVEVFSTEYWGMNQQAYIEKIKAAYLKNS
ncbi:MAG: hypothetical protein PWP23_1155 [Candidatus Sumerlaeota bacterium]|nr:hypothetical protein [Candidatus Sumerlaeota bacterium]